MAESILNSLLHMLDRKSIAEMANSLGISDQSVSRCIESSIAVVLGGMASKAEDPGSLRRMLDLSPANSGEITWPHLASSLSNPNSPLIAGGKRVISSLFGTSEGAMTRATGSQCNLEPGAVATLLAIAAPMVMSFLSKRVSDEGMSMASLGRLLEVEVATIQSTLPAGLTDLFRPRYSAATGASPVVAQYVKGEPGLPRWFPALAVSALGLGIFILLSHARRPAGEIGPAVTGSASRVANEANLGDFVQRKLPNNVDLNIPAKGTESRLLAFLQDPNATVEPTSWFDFDRLSFQPGSASLGADSREQLDNIAAILAAYPAVRVNIAAYAHGVGGAEHNLELSRARADGVRSALVARGIAPDRLTTEGLGERNASTDNSAQIGRVRNRRASLRVTQK